MINKISIENFFKNFQINYRTVAFVWLFLSFVSFYILFTFVFSSKEETLMRQPLIFTNYVENIEVDNDKLNNTDISLLTNKSIIEIDNNSLIRKENLEKAALASSVEIDSSILRKNIFLIKGQSNVNMFKDYFNDSNIVPLIKRLSIEPRSFDNLIRESVNLGRPLNELIIDLDTLGLSKIRGRILLDNLVQVINKDLENTLNSDNYLKKISQIESNKVNPMVFNLKIKQIKNGIEQIDRNYSNVDNKLNIEDLKLMLAIVEEELMGFYKNVQYEKIFLDKLNLEIKNRMLFVENISSAINNIENSTSINVISEDRQSANAKETKNNITYDGDAINQISRLVSESNLAKLKSKLINEQIDLKNSLAEAIGNYEYYLSLSKNSLKSNISHESLTNSINNLSREVNNYIDVIALYNRKNALTPASSVIVYERDQYTIQNIIIFISISMLLFILSNLIILFTNKRII